MRTYVATTGVLFLLLTLAHVVRVYQETHLARAPWFWIATIAPFILAVWALRLYQRTARPPG